MLPRFPLAALVVLALAAPATAYPAYMATEIQDSDNHVDASRCDWDPLGVYVRGYADEDCRNPSYGGTVGDFLRAGAQRDNYVGGNSNNMRDDAR